MYMFTYYLLWSVFFVFWVYNSTSGGGGEIVGPLFKVKDCWVSDVRALSQWAHVWHAQSTGTWCEMSPSDERRTLHWTRTWTWAWAWHESGLQADREGFCTLAGADLWHPTAWGSKRSVVRRGVGYWEELQMMLECRVQGIAGRVHQNGIKFMTVDVGAFDRHV